MARKRKRPPGGKRELVVETMLRVLARPRPGRRSPAQVNPSPWKVAIAAHKAAKVARLKYDTCYRYYKDWLASGGSVHSFERQQPEFKRAIRIGVVRRLRVRLVKRRRKK